MPYKKYQICQAQKRTWEEIEYLGLLQLGASQCILNELAKNVYIPEYDQ